MSQETESEIKTEDEVQYVYDEDEELVFDPSLNEAVNENGINDYYFPDGTRAIFVDGQYYIPADAQAIVLQDGQEDLNSYIINQDCDSIILSEDQDCQDINEQSSDTPEFIHYVESRENDGQQIIYFTSADGAVNFDGYETAETFVDQDGQLEGIQEMQENSMLSHTEDQPAGMQQTVDLEELVKQQNGENQIVVEGVPPEDVRQYRYAIVKDGKLHIQNSPSEQQEEGSEVNNYNGWQSETTNDKESRLVDLNQITGRNLITGQTVTLHEYMAKLQRKLNKNPEATAAVASVTTASNNPEKTVPLNQPSSLMNIPNNSTRINKTIKPKLIDKSSVEKERKAHALKNLLNLTIPIGKTTNGKRIVGRIVHVETKNSDIEVSGGNGDNVENQSSFQFGNAQEQYQDLPELINEDAVETFGIDPDDNAECSQLSEVVEMIDENNIHTKEIKALTQIDESSTLSDDILQRIQYVSQEQENIEQETRCDVLKTSMQTQGNDLMQQKAHAITKKLNLKIGNANMDAQNSMQTNPVPDPAVPTADSDKPVKIIVKSHKISKECYDDICKTLCGLMEMATVQKKLIKKNLAVKVIEKKFSSKDGKLLKSAFHVYGYMAMEYVLSSGDEILQKWRFVPDKNTQDALLTDEMVQQGGVQNESKSCKYVETVVVTLLMTYDKSGKRSIKVILNPSTGNKCSICTKEFKNYTDAQIHMTRVHNIDGSQTRCHRCHAQFESVKALEEHKEKHISEGQLIRCTFCKDTFTTTSRLYRHMAMHVPAMKPLECSLCHQRCVNENSLKKHLLSHTGIKLYKCSFCERKYTSQSNLTEHQKVHHPLKYFECEVCNRKFTRLSNLVRHNEIHKKNGRALFSCELCGASYCFSSSLTRHIVQNHINADSS